MKKLLVFGLALMTLATVGTSCKKSPFCQKGDGVASRTLEISDFTGVDLKLSGQVNITQGSPASVSVTTHNNFIEKINTHVSNGTWEIKFKDNKCYDLKEFRVDIVVPNLNSVSVSGSGNASVGNFTEQSSMSLTCSGSGKIDANQFTGVNTWNAVISGSGLIRCNGSVDGVSNSKVTISGSGNYNGYQVKSKNTVVKISGSGNADVYASESLDVQISGSGNVGYKGQPKIQQNISGSGNLNNRN